MSKPSVGKQAGLLICLVAYLVAVLMVWLVYDVVSVLSPIAIVFILDLVATLIIFIFSLIFNNSSLYDPYWSVAPPIIVAWWLYFHHGLANLEIVHIVIFALVFFWSARLTWNWIRRWRGLNDEDWRYIAFRYKFQKNYWLVSFAAIHMFPTAIVFLGLLALYPSLASSTAGMGLMEIIATIITVIAISIEMISDHQLWKYLDNKINCNFLATGLWKYSRHPNYFGEVLFWFGLFLFSTGVEKLYWWILPGPVAMILMFYMVSIPMIDKRMMRKKTGYRDFIKVTSPLIPWPPYSRSS